MLETVLFPRMDAASLGRLARTCRTLRILANNYLTQWSDQAKQVLGEVHSSFKTENPTNMKHVEAALTQHPSTMQYLQQGTWGGVPSVGFQSTSMPAFSADGRYIITLHLTPYQLNLEVRAVSDPCKKFRSFIGSLNTARLHDFRCLDQANHFITVRWTPVQPREPPLRPSVERAKPPARFPFREPVHLRECTLLPPLRSRCEKLDAREGKKIIPSQHSTAAHAFCQALASMWLSLARTGMVAL